MNFLIRVLTTAVALAVAAWIFSGIRFEGATKGMAEVEDKLLELLLVALILALVSSFVKPILQILSIPFIIITLGLFLILINAAMLGLTAWLAGKLNIGFHVEGFWTAIGGAIVISLVSWVLDGFVGEDRTRGLAPH